MKTILLFVVILLAEFAVKGDLPTGAEDAHGFNASSYSEIGLGHYMSAAFSLNDPAHTNHWVDHSRSGSGLEADAELQWEKWGLPGMAACLGNHYDLFIVNDNGGYNHSTQLSPLTNYVKFPTNLYDGSAYVPSSGWASTNHVIYICGGGIPADASDGGGDAMGRNQAALEFGTNFFTYHVDMWNSLWPLILSDQVSPRDFWNSILGGGHPSCAGCLMISIKWLKAIGADTIVNTALLDWNTGLKVSTNRCVVSGESKSSKTFSWISHADRHAMAWDVPNATTGITNDARRAFIIEPALSNAFFEGFQIQNAPDGSYAYYMDDHFDRMTTGVELRAGFNLFTDYNNPIWEQRVLVLALTRDQYGNNRITLAEYSGFDVGQPQIANQLDLKSNEDGAYGGIDEDGLRGDALIAAVSTAVNHVRYRDALINIAAQPVNHTNTLIYLGSGKLKLRK